MRVATDDGFTEAMTTIPPNPEEALVTISTPESDTVRVRDRVESSRFEFYSENDVEIEEVPTDELFFPTDVAAKISPAEDIYIPVYSGFIVHDHDSGNVYEKNISEIEDTVLRDGSFEIEVLSAPMKVYLRIDTDADIVRTPNSIEISFREPSSFVLGVRSHHERPAGTIVTPEDVESVMTAVSHFGSALKTTSPERSWPTLRGYPPRVELGGSLSIPDSIQQPETDVVIEVPPTLDSVFKVAPLSYYLAAEVRPLERPGELSVLRAAGTDIHLHGDVSDAATRILQDNLLLDSVVRNQGFYSVDTFERRAIEDQLPWDPAEVYDLPLDERIAAYDSVPEEVLSTIRPTWPLTADLAPESESVEVLPHVAEELAKVRVPEPSGTTVDPEPEYVEDFIRADGAGIETGERATGQSAVEPRITTPQPWDTQMHVSLLDEYPIGSNTTSSRAYERHIELEAPDQGTIEVHVVCNDDEMREEEVVTELYGVRDLLEFDVNFHYKLTQSELCDLLAESFDLVHYIGHIDEDGILCEDGYLDVRTDVNEVGVGAFILNACSSVDQGQALLEHGAIGGIATLFDVPNSSATKLGRTLSRLLNRGFPIRAAMNIARDSSILGRRWVSMGNGRVSLTQSEGAFPYVINIDPESDGSYDVELELFETTSHRIGAIAFPAASWGTGCVMPNRTRENISEEELEELFSYEISPIRCNGNLYWTDEIAPKDIRKEESV